MVDSGHAFAVAPALLIVNPFASAVTEERVAAVEAVLRRAGPLETRHTEDRGHATELARDAGSSVRAIYVFSGDGGYNEVLNGLDGTIPVGLVPGGGASVLPRGLGLPRDPVAAAERIVAGRERRIALGRVNGRRFGFSAGLGFDAELVRRVDNRGRTRERGRPGNLTFALTAFRMLLDRRGRIEPTLAIAGVGRVAFALVAKGDPYTYAGLVPLHIAPEARFELGLDLVAPRAVRPRMLPRLLVYAVTGRGQSRARDVVYRHDLDRLEIACDVPTALQVDGEDLGNVERAVFEAERDAVTILV
jgi:diacylglycerol kinase family enzyme